MLSFKDLTEENKESVTKGLSAGLCDPEARELMEDVASSFYELIDENGDTGVAFCVEYGCFLARIFDMGRYIFVYPIPITEGADVFSAVDGVCEYAVRQEVPLVFSDVPREEVLTVVSLIRHANIDSEDVEGESFRIEAKSECSLLSEIPEYDGGEITLGPEGEEDAEKIAQLACNDEVNRYWGFDYRDDIPEGCVLNSYFFDESRAEFERGVSMTLAVRYNGEFVGECVLYAFDYKGGAEIAVRIFPEHWGKKIGTRALRAGIELAKRIGLIRLYTVIDERNTRSKAMVKGEFDVTRVEGGLVYYERDLY